MAGGSRGEMRIGMEPFGAMYRLGVALLSACVWENAFGKICMKTRR